MKSKVLCIGNPELFAGLISEADKKYHFTFSKEYFDELETFNRFDLVLYQSNNKSGISEKIIKRIREQFGNEIVIFPLTDEPILIPRFMRCGADDVFEGISDIDNIKKRFSFLVKQKKKSIKQDNTQSKARIYTLPLWKRLFDILFASVALLFLTPFFLIIALLIRLESKGKVFYLAPRVGAGYKLFGFYKFRSMYMDADKRVAELMKQNQYATDDNENRDTSSVIAENDITLYGDGYAINESEHLLQKKNKESQTFFKLANDPRITKVGRFIRNTSIDELPQLVNVLKGDMSIVGNRPLPLYEAEMLTKDASIKRFLAPAGLTGLWQVTKRGGANKMSADERCGLDVEYANKYSFWTDLGIILKTVPAMIQHENV